MSAPSVHQEPAPLAQKAEQQNRFLRLNLAYLQTMKRHDRHRPFLTNLRQTVSVLVVPVPTPHWTLVRYRQDAAPATVLRVALGAASAYYFALHLRQPNAHR